MTAQREIKKEVKHNKLLDFLTEKKNKIVIFFILQNHEKNFF